MKQYDALDRHIVKAIARGVRTFTAISHNGAVACEAYLIHEQTGVAHWRVVYRRLQALRKAGRIVYAKGAWSVVGRAQETTR